MGRLSENSIVVMKNKSHSITAEIEVPDGGANGVIVAQGGAFGGLALYAKDGKPAYCYNLFGLQRFKVYGDEAIPAGEHQVRMEFTYDGGGLGKGGDVALFVDGEQVGEGRVDGTVPMLFSADETTDVGSDTATPVSDDYGPRDSEFTGTVRWVQIDIDAAAEDTDHLITPGGAPAGRDGAAVASARGAADAAPRNDEQWPRYRSVAPGAGQCPDHPDAERDHEDRPERVVRDEEEVLHRGEDRHHDRDRRTPRRSGVEPVAREHEQDPEQQVDPSPGARVDVERVVLRDDVEVVVDDRDQTGDDLEEADHGHHDDGEGDAADRPPRGGRARALLGHEMLLSEVRASGSGARPRFLRV